MARYGIVSFAFVVFVASVTLAIGASLEGRDDGDSVQILKYENDNIGVDGYKFAFKTSDGVSREETATLKNPGTEHEAISVQGTVTWISSDGLQYTLNYLADENGFQPEGKHLPVAPEP